MSKTDHKKGLFKGLQITRSEAIFRLLSKLIQPLSLYGEEIGKIKEYLYQFSIDPSETRKRRSKVFFF